MNFVARVFSLSLCVLLVTCISGNGQTRSNNSYGYHGSFGGYNGYRPHYTYSYPSYYGYGTNYYTPTYGYCAPSVAPMVAPLVQPAAESTTDKVFKELIIRKLLAEQGMGAPQQPSAPPLALTAPGESALTADEVAQLREVIKAIRERAKPAEKKE